MTHPQNGAIQHSFEQRMAFTVGLFPLIDICVFSCREKILFHGFDEEYNSFLLSSISQFEVGGGFRFDVPNWRLVFLENWSSLINLRTYIRTRVIAPQ